MARKIDALDFQKIVLVSDPQFSPDGTRIACVRKHIDPDKSAYRSEIWLVADSANPAPRRFTGGDWSDSSPRWSPDGTQIAFLSSRNKPKSQIYLIPADGGEAHPLTNLEIEGGINAISWSPDGTRIAFLFRATPEAWRKEAVEERQKKELPPPPRFHKRMFYRLDGFGYFDGEYAQVWVADAKTGAAQPLTTGEYNCESLTWSPDSATIAFLSDRRDDFDVLPTHTDIWTVPAAGGPLTHIPSPHGPKEALTWSPDGSRFAYIGNPDPKDLWGTRNNHVFVLPATGAETAQDLTGHTDLDPGYLTLSDSHEVGAGDQLQWNSVRTALFFPISTFGDTRLYFVEAQGGNPIPISPEGHEMGGFTLTPDGRAAVTLGSPTSPHVLAVLYAPTTSDGSVTAETKADFNREWKESVQIVEPEPLELDNGDGGTVYGWLLRPPDFHQSEKYPLVVYVHGGPHAQYGNIFFHELQFLAAAGYVVVYMNPRGSKGYGEAYTSAIKGNWGSVDFQDIMTATDYATGLSYVDASCTAIMGGSYGGYMTSWAIGHTNRFTCAIADRLVANLHSMSGTVDFPWRHGYYFGGDAWSDPAELWRCSPLAYAGNIETPLLLIHSDGDLRCDVGQAEELFAALRHQRKPVEFVRYPAESSHGLSRNGPPSLRLDRLQRNLAWLDRHLKP